MLVSIVIPFYNEEESIVKTHEALNHEFVKESDINFEYVFVNDGSRDRTLDLMKEIVARDPKVKFVSFSRNFGKEAAILAGFEHATGELVVLMDGDLQHPPSVVRQMIQGYLEGYDIISAKRTRDGESRQQTFFAKAFYRVANNLMDIRLVDGVSDFRAFSRRAVDAIISLREYNRFSKGIFSWIGFKEKTIEYQNQLRQAGTTKFNFKSSMNYAIQGITSFNDRPLRLCVNVGLGCLALAALYVIWQFFAYILHPEDAVSGYFTTIFAVVLFGGIQLISIGVLGEYIGKIYYEVKQRPHYIIEQTNIKSDQEK
ncbi:glycosyltransferase PgfS [Vaginisenegalia massiliensis]|uniref:glycosyltransferase PgfS n=1 Tax=Vaginisenegalia massiliensis TaxID=2058294 RepID=UPI000F51BC86|nr:glycosyltransferase family 2 protein [Vaginisenegalia massiliensis]